MLLKDIVKHVKTDRPSHYRIETNVILLNAQIEMFSFPLSSTYFEILSEHGPAVASLCSKMSKIRGVETVFVSPYEIGVHMAGINKITDEIRKIVSDFIDLCAVLEENDTPRQLATLNISKLDDGPITMDLSAEITKKKLTLERNTSERKLAGLNKEVKKLLKGLLSIEGVISIEVTYYKITVNYAPLFDKFVVAQKVVEEYIKFVK